MAEDAVRCEPFSLLTGNSAAILDVIQPAPRPKASLQHGFSWSLMSIEQGFFSAYQGTALVATGATPPDKCCNRR
jgi:hypothetical protein